MTTRADLVGRVVYVCRINNLTIDDPTAADVQQGRGPQLEYRCLVVGKRVAAVSEDAGGVELLLADGSRAQLSECYMSQQSALHAMWVNFGQALRERMAGGGHAS